MQNDFRGSYSLLVILLEGMTSRREDSQQRESQREVYTAIGSEKSKRLENSTLALAGDQLLICTCVVSVDWSSRAYTCCIV